MADFSKVDFGSDKFLFAYQELGEFETSHAGKFKDIKEFYKDFLKEHEIPFDKDASFQDLEDIFIEMAQEFMEYRARRVNEFTQRRLERNAKSKSAH